MVLCRPASGSLRHPLNLTTSLFARMHFSFIQLQAPVVAYFPQQWHCCVPSRSMGDQIGVVDSGPSVCSEPHKCESDVWGAAAVEVWQHMCCARLLVSLCSEHLSLCVDLLCSTLWDWQTADVRGSHLPKNPAGNLVLPKKIYVVVQKPPRSCVCRSPGWKWQCLHGWQTDRGPLLDSGRDQYRWRKVTTRSFNVLTAFARVACYLPPL